MWRGEGRRRRRRRGHADRSFVGEEFHTTQHSTWREWQAGPFFRGSVRGPNKTNRVFPIIWNIHHYTCYVCILDQLFTGRTLGAKFGPRDDIFGQGSLSARVFFNREYCARYAVLLLLPLLFVSTAPLPLLCNTHQPPFFPTSQDRERCKTMPNKNANGGFNTDKNASIRIFLPLFSFRLRVPRGWRCQSSILRNG